MSQHYQSLFRGAVRPRKLRRGHAQSHPGVSPLSAVGHRNTSYQPLPRALGNPPYHYDLAEKFPDIGKAIKDADKMTFHVIADTGGVKDSEFQLLVAQAMTDDLDRKHGADKPLFCYHGGDVVYFTGEIDEYYPQFYEPYEHYQAPIFAIPGNHDGEVDDPSTGRTSLDGFVRYFMVEKPDVDPISKDSPRVQLDLPNVYWTLVTPFATLVGMYTNVPEHGSIDSVQQQWVTNEFATAPTDRALILALHHPIYSFDDHHSGSSRMADVLENAIWDTGRVPNMVISGHVHNYQRIEQTMAPGKPTPFLVTGNGGYHNLHKVRVDPGAVDPDNGATLRFANSDTWGFVTLSIDKHKIRGHVTNVLRDGTTQAGDSFEYSAEPIVMPDPRDLKTL